MWGRVVPALAAGVVLLAGCGGGGPSAESVAEQLSQEFPAPNSTDNSSACDEGERACDQLVTTDAVSVWEFPDTETARHWMREGPMSLEDEYKDPRQVGRFILTFAQERQQLTSDEARQAYVDELRGILDES